MATDTVPTDDPLEAENNRKAVGISNYNGKAVAIGDETKDEWITGQNIEVINVEDMI